MPETEVIKKPPLLDQGFLVSSLLPMGIEERRRFEQNLIKYGLLQQVESQEFSLTSPIVVEPYGTLHGETGEIRFKELAAEGVNYVGLRAPDDVMTSQVWTLPRADGVNGQFLATDGVGGLYWEWPYWIKAGNDVYYMNHVAIGAPPSSSYEFYVSGLSAFIGESYFYKDSTVAWDETVVIRQDDDSVGNCVCLSFYRSTGDTADMSGTMVAYYDDLAHGITSVAPTNQSWGIGHWTDATGIGTGTQGGFYVAGYSEGEMCLGFEANYTTGNTSIASAFAPVVYKIFLKSGTSRTVATTGHNLFAIASGSSFGDPDPVLILQQGGKLLLFNVSSTPTAILGIGDTSDTNVTSGIVVNQLSADDTILSLKSSDVNHGVTTLNELDTYGAFLKATAATGGLKIRGFTEATDALLLMGIYTTDNTTKSTSGRAAVEVWGQRKNTNNTQDPNTDGNIFGIMKNTAPSALWLCDVEGDTWQAGTITATRATLNIAAGNAPLIITSSTLCANLNADLWDGYHQFMSTTAEPTGFPNRTDTTISWDDGTRTLTLTGTNFTVWLNGVQYTLNTDTFQIPDTTGLYYFYLTPSSGTLDLTASTTWPGFTSVLVATVYWNTTAGMDKGLVADERHGIVMDSATHELFHDTIGVRYESGLAGTFADSTFSISAGYIHDEDIDFQITPAKTACDVLYLDGSTTWKWLANQTVYYYTSGGNLYWNDGTTLTAAAANKYVAVWIFATTSPIRPIISIIGQVVSNTLADARNNNKYESLSLGTLPFKEMKLLYRVILHNDATPYEEAQDLRSVSNISSGTYVATAHAALTGLTTGDDHTQYAYVKVHATDSPGVNDDITYYRVGTIWVEEDANKVYILVDNADGAAVWQEVGAGGVGSFLDLTDVTEADYVGHANQFVKVNAAENGLEFVASSVAAHALSSASHTDVDAGAPSDNDILRYDSASGKWKNEALPAAASHDLLDGSVHGDTVVQSVSRGSIIYGNSTPKWSELVIGASGYVLASDGTDIAWSLVPTHASRHQSGGADAIKLDDLAAPDDNTDLDVSTAKHGLAPKAPNDVLKFLRGDATWANLATKIFNRISGRYYSSGLSGSSITTQAWTKDYVYVWPFYVLETQTFDRIAIAITANNGAGRKAMIGLYDNVTTNGVAYPNNLLDSFECDFSTTGIKEDTASWSQTLTPGLYWFAFCQSYACTVRNISLAQCPSLQMGHADAASAPDTYMYLAHAYDSALPNPFTAGATPSVVASGLPFVCMRLA